MNLTRRHLLFGAFCLVAAGLYADALLALYQYARADSSASHLILMPVIAAGLVYQARTMIFAVASVDLTFGGIVTGAGLALGLGVPASGSYEGSASLGVAILSLVTIWVGGFTLIYGRHALRRAAFPLLFLGLTIPIPLVLLKSAVDGLKAGSAAVVEILFTLTGTVYHRDEFIFYLPGVAIEIADACSGIRSSIALTLTAVLAGYLYLDSPAKRVVLILAVLPVAILKNAIRIATLTLLSIHVDPSFLSGQLHHDGGVVFFLLGLVMMVPVLAALRSPWRHSWLRTVSQPIS
jgi:exosortase